MFSLQEMTAWTPRDIEAAIHAALPQGWQFAIKKRRGIFLAAFADEGGEVAWAREGIDERLALFDAYGWLRQRQQPLVGEVWKRRRREVPRPHVGPLSLPGVRVPDPQDLDPAEIDVVYRGHLNRRK